jgi:hypothetical protein
LALASVPELFRALVGERLYHQWSLMCVVNNVKH